MSDLQTIGKAIVLAGLALAALGVILWIGGRLGLGSLPGNLRLGDESWGCYLPIGTMILLSLALTLIVNLVLRLLNR